MPIGIASSRSRVPEERSRSVVTLVTRNITMKGNSASSAGPKRSKTGSTEASNIHHSSVISTHGSTSSIASVRWSRRSWVSTRAATAAVIRGAHAASARRAVGDEGQEGRLDVRGAGRLADLGRGVVGDDPPLAHQQQPVAAVGLVHDVAGDEDRGAAVGEPVEQLPEVAAQHGVEADGRLVEHQQVGVAEQRDREADAASAGRR